MRSNPVKEKLARGEHAFGTMIFEFFTPGIAQIAKNAGAEFILYDMEHSGVDYGVIKEQFAYCRGLELVPMVRVPTTQYHLISRALDLGAMGIMVPMVETREQAEFIVSCTRYPPAGSRGAAFGVAQDDYQGGDVKQKIAQAHARTFVICQIETAKGLENVESIGAVPGVDCLWVGHFDLTNFMGIPAEFSHPKYLAALDKVVATCHKRNIPAGFMPVDEKWALDYLAKGFRIMAYGMDILLLQTAIQQGISALRGNVNGSAEAHPKNAARTAGSGPRAKATRAVTKL
jgi:2-keto-3-deoxy-L-rhamnonate aldolase RhmA